MEEKEIIGILSEKLNTYSLTKADGTKYNIYSILPWESVSPDFDTGKFAPYIGKKVKVFGRFQGTEIWGATVHSFDGNDIVPPKIDDLMPKKR